MSKQSVGQTEGNRSEASADRRKAHRHEVVVRVAYATVDEIFSEFVRNINEGGLFIETESPHPVETNVTLRFRLPGCDEPIEAAARVVWSTPGGEGEPPGMGLCFDRLSPEAREQIDRLIRGLRRDGPPR